jgi:hypothetical protein
MAETTTTMIRFVSITARTVPARCPTIHWSVGSWWQRKSRRAFSSRSQQKYRLQTGSRDADRFETQAAGSRPQIR